MPTEHVGKSIWAQDATGKDLPPSLRDISQGTVGDCYLFAAMAALGNSDPQRIVNMIRVNGNGTYTVTFRGIGLFSSATQTVTADFPVGQHGAATPTGAFWPLIIEKAYAQEKGSIAKITGGNPGDAVDDMINDSPSRFDPREESATYIMAKLAYAKVRKWPAVVLSPEQANAGKSKQAIALSTPGLYFWHSYAVIDIDQVKQKIKLFNPWGGIDQPNTDGWVTVELIRKFFIEVDIND